MTDRSDYLDAFYGRFKSLLTWAQLDEFWERLRRQADGGWYIYAVGEKAPSVPASADEVEEFISAIDELLRREHQEDYCGIVYADNHSEPTMIKIYDPNNLGVSCGFSKNPPPPGWVLSRLPPQSLEHHRPPPEGRRRWWQRLWA